MVNDEYEKQNEIDDPVMLVAGYVFGTLFTLLLYACTLLPYITAFPNPSDSARTAMWLLAGVPAVLLCVGLVRAAFGVKERERKSLLMRVHQTVGAIFIYTLVGGFGVMFLSLGSPLIGWIVIGVLIAAALLFAYRFYRCPHCRRMFAAELFRVERIGTASSTTFVTGWYGMVVPVKQEYGIFRRVYRCRFCLKTWAK